MELWRIAFLVGRTPSTEAWWGDRPAQQSERWAVTVGRSGSLRGTRTGLSPRPPGGLAGGQEPAAWMEETRVWAGFSFEFLLITADITLFSFVISKMMWTVTLSSLKYHV